MTKKLTTTGIMLAFAVILSLIRIFDAPYGGSVTACSMLPVIILSLLYGTKWGILSGIVFAFLSMLFTGVPAPPVKDILSYVWVFLLDYILAFGVLGLSGLLYRLFGKKRFAAPAACAAVIIMRFLCHFASGILIWSVYAWEGVGAAMYSFLYNGSYMLFELLLTTAAITAVWPFVKKVWKQ